MGILWNHGVIVGPVVTDATAEQEVLGSIPGSDQALLGFSINNFLTLELCSVSGNRLSSYYVDLENKTGEMWVHH